MGQIDNLNSSEIPDILRRLRVLENASPLNNAAIGRNGLRVYDGGGITIENGGLQVVGSGTFEGTLYADGTIAFTGNFSQSGPSVFTGDTSLNGPTHINGNTDVTGDFKVTGPTHLNGTTDVTGNTTVTGDFKVTGPTHLEGPTDIKGTLSVQGVTTLEGDMTVTGGGQITAGNTTITPDASNGGIEFVSGGGVGGNGGTVVMKGSGNAGVIAGNTTGIFSGASQITVGDGYVTVDGIPTISGVTPNLYMDPSSRQIKRIV